MTVRKSLAQEEEYRVRDTEGDGEPQEMPPKFDLYVYALDGHDDLTEVGDALRAWAKPRGRRFSLMRSIPRAEAALLARPQPATDVSASRPTRDPVDADYAELERLARAATPIYGGQYVRAQVAGGRTATDVAAELGISFSSACRVIRGETWTHVR